MPVRYLIVVVGTRLIASVAQFIERDRWTQNRVSSCTMDDRTSPNELGNGRDQSGPYEKLSIEDWQTTTEHSIYKTICSPQLLFLDNRL